MKKTPMLAFLFLLVPAVAAGEEAAPAPAAPPAPAPEVKADAPASEAPAPVVAPTVAPQPSPEEVKALEEQMKAAQQAIDAKAAADAQTTAPAAAPTTDVQPAPQANQVEEITAIPVAEGQTQGGTAAVAVSAAEDKKDDKPFALGVTLSHGIGSGTFVANEFVRESNDSVGLTVDIRPSYTFDVMGHKLKLGGRFLFDVSYTDPIDAIDRYVTPYDLRFSVSDAELYKEALTDITVSAGFTAYLPTSFESINIKQQWFAGKLWGSLSRSIGPVDLGYTLGATKYFNGSKVKQRFGQVARGGETEENLSVADPVSISAGTANNNWLVDNTFEVTYNVTEQLAIGYSLMILNYFKYEMPVDQYTATYVDGLGDAVGQADQLWPTLEASYDVTDLVKGFVDVPVTLAVAAGITALHPAYSADNQEFLWPVFFNTFGSNRAANNYGSVYFDLSGTY